MPRYLGGLRLLVVVVVLFGLLGLDPLPLVLEAAKSAVCSLNKPLVGITGPFVVLFHATNEKGWHVRVEEKGPLPNTIQCFDRNTEGHCSRLADSALMINVIFDVVRDLLRRTDVLTSLFEVAGGAIRRLPAELHGEVDHAWSAAIADRSLAPHR